MTQTLAIINTVYQENHIKLTRDIRDDIFIFGYDRLSFIIKEAAKAAGKSRTLKIYHLVKFLPF